ncbi:MAG TPA: hypothetical protein VGP63_18860 [Planctomycetaceae bacterium]|nr:hypothetical protein [Planctomycetaceae bacterium]
MRVEHCLYTNTATVPEFQALRSLFTIQAHRDGQAPSDGTPS